VQTNTIFGDPLSIGFEALLDNFDSGNSSQTPVRPGEHRRRRVLEARWARPDDIADLADPHDAALHRDPNPDNSSPKLARASCPARIPVLAGGGTLCNTPHETTHLMPHSSARDPQSTSEAPKPLDAHRRGGPGLANTLAFSNGLPAAIAIGLSFAATESLESANGAHSALIAGCGTFVVYAIDRLRDTIRDRSTSPLRTAFVLRHARALRFSVAIAGVVLLLALFVAPLGVVLLCATVGGFGIFHRRLKEIPALKTLYVSLAWVTASVAIPWMSSALPPDDSSALWAGAILFATIAGNLIASNHRDGDAGVLNARPGWTLGLARAFVGLGFAFALAGPESIRALAWIPIAEGLALAFYRPTEHYGQLIVDGALLLGSLASLLHFTLG
jgi:hypothetical protein